MAVAAIPVVVRSRAASPAIQALAASRVSLRAIQGPQKAKATRDSAVKAIRRRANGEESGPGSPVPVDGSPVRIVVHIHQKTYPAVARTRMAGQT